MTNTNPEARVVEAVARAIRESSGWPTPWDDLVPGYQDTYRTQARAAIKALIDAGMEIRDVRPIGKQVHEWLSNENNREQIRKMMEKFERVSTAKLYDDYAKGSR